MEFHKLFLSIYRCFQLIFSAQQCFSTSSSVSFCIPSFDSMKMHMEWITIDVSLYIKYYECLYLIEVEKIERKEYKMNMKTKKSIT